MIENNILYAEDDPADFWLLERAFEAERIREWLHVVSDGTEAMAWLSGEGEYRDRAKHPLPQLLLLDIRLPKVNGFQVLRWLRAQPQFVALPVVVFSGDYQEGQIAESYRLGASLFLCKPCSPDEMRQVARFLKAWVDRSGPPAVSEPEWQALKFYGDAGLRSAA